MLMRELPEFIYLTTEEKLRQIGYIFGALRKYEIYDQQSYRDVFFDETSQSIISTSARAFTDLKNCLGSEAKQQAFVLTAPMMMIL